MVKSTQQLEENENYGNVIPQPSRAHSQTTMANSNPDQQARVPYLSEHYYKMKDILHHAFAAKNKKPRKRHFDSNILVNRQTKSELRSECESPLIEKKLKKQAEIIPFKFRRNPILGMQYSHKPRLDMSNQVSLHDFDPDSP